MSNAMILKCLSCDSTRMSEPKDCVTMCLECEADWETEALTKINWELHDKDVRIRELEKKLAEATEKINTPQIHDFIEAVENEAIHQQLRWGDNHDKDKSPHDWVTLISYLQGKQIMSLWDGDYEKHLHHIITMAAVCYNWHTHALNELPDAIKPLPASDEVKNG